MSGLTPSQTVGPFWHVGLPWDDGSVLVTEETQGERIMIRGRILDGDGTPVTDGMVEIWQADAGGRFAHPLDRQNSPRDPSFRGFGRTETDPTGTFSFETVKPGGSPGADGRPQAPHVNVSIFSRGLLDRLVTRLYFEDEPANAEDPVLAQVPADRRATLIARLDKGEANKCYTLDIRLQGENETVFFAV